MIDLEKEVKIPEFSFFGKLHKKELKPTFFMGNSYGTNATSIFICFDFVNKKYSP